MAELQIKDTFSNFLIELKKNLPYILYRLGSVVPIQKCVLFLFAPVAQMAEHVTFNHGVRSSTLRRRTNGFYF